MKAPRPLVVVGLAATLILIGVWLIKIGQRGNPSTRPSPSGSDRPALDAISQSDSPRDYSNLSPTQYIARVFDRLRSEGLAPGELNAFRRALLTAPRDAAINAIINFLSTGQDARTTEPFEIGKNGELIGAPTFRVLLLDLLGRLCRDADRTEALAVAREVLQSKSSADEWAVALRNTAWRTPGERGFLAEKAREMINYQPWRQRPTVGFREAFDVIVFTRDTSFIPDLADMIQSEDESLQRSAGVALDRLAEMSPLEVMAFLNTNRSELADRPFLRADYYSKANLSEPAQRVAIETYLTRPDVGQAEKEKLISAFASPGTFASDSLVTTAPPEELPASYAIGLRQTVDDWIKTNRFPALTRSLLNLRAHIGE